MSLNLYPKIRRLRLQDYGEAVFSESLPYGIRLEKREVFPPESLQSRPGRPFCILVIEKPVVEKGRGESLQIKSRG
jgi:hypothetical protein